MILAESVRLQPVCGTECRSREEKIWWKILGLIEMCTWLRAQWNRVFGAWDENRLWW